MAFDSTGYSKLLDAQSNNAPSIITLLPDDCVYNINLETREIDAIDAVIVEQDHRSRTIYFKMPRYYDNMDLATTVGIVTYKNANKNEFIYVIPFYDVDTYSTGDAATGTTEPMMLFPWVISENAAELQGKITFSISFYRVAGTATANNIHYVYNLRTLPQTLVIKQGLNLTQLNTTDAETQRIQSAYYDFLQTAALAAQEGSLTWEVVE